MSIKNSKNYGEIISIIRNLFESVSDIIFILDTESRIILASQSFCDFVSVQFKNIVNETIFKLGAGQWDKPEIREALKVIKSGKKAQTDVELKIDLNPGCRRLVILDFRRIEISEEQYITGRVKKLIYPKNTLEVQNRNDIQSLKLAQISIEHAPEAVYWINREGKFTYVNEQACLLLGYSRKEFTKLKLWDIDSHFPKKKWDEAWKSRGNEGQMNMDRIHTRHRRKDGTEILVEVAAKHITFGGYEFHVSFARDISERKMYEKALNITQAAIDNASIACLWINDSGKITYANNQACASLGYNREELLKLLISDLDPEFGPERWQEFWDDIANTRAKSYETNHQRKDNSIFPVEITANYIENDGEKYICLYARDLSDYRRSENEKAELEMQLYQAQKMETIGRLAGGIAHDFNNMLSVILGYTEMLKERMLHEPDSYEDLTQIEKAANHSKEITRQLLAFSRKQIIAPKKVNINDSIESTRRTVIRLIGENIKLKFIPQEDIWLINFDPSQLDQIFVNLALNARDAMSKGGNLTIMTGNVHADDAYCREHVEVEPGDYVLLTVSDDGAGMDKETLSYIFEPFFTTKSVDQGSGLGLATVYGIVMQNNGFISVQSAPGAGTTFRIHIPKFEPEPGAGEEESLQKIPAQSATGTILLVEDDEMLRRMTTLMLEDIGYTVFSAGGPLEALSVFSEKQNLIDLLMTDVVMPEMSGVELKEKISKINPGICVLFMSGYTSHVIVDHGVLEEGVHFIQKPFTMNDLDKLVREAMGNDQ